jgi:hypothetical protein
VVHEAEQRVRHEVAFRRANEQLAAVQDGLRIEDAPAPFICECDEVTCFQVLFVRRSDYERVRAEGRHFVVVTGHNGHESRLVAEHNGYCVVEKQGRSGELAAELDPRRSEAS